MFNINKCQHRYQDRTNLFTSNRRESKVFNLDQGCKRAREMSAWIASAAETGSLAARMGLPTTR